MSRAFLKPRHWRVQIFKVQNRLIALQSAVKSPSERGTERHMWRSIAFFREKYYMLSWTRADWRISKCQTERNTSFSWRTEKIRAKYLRANNPVVQPLRLLPAATRASAYESVAPSVYTSLRAASRWWTNLLVDQLGSQTRSRRPTSRSKASSTFECCRAFAPSSNSLSCTTTLFALRRKQGPQIHTRFVSTHPSRGRVSLSPTMA